MTNEMIAAILKALLAQFPQLGWATLILQLQVLGEGAVEEFKKWWEMEMDEPWPGMPEMPLPHPQGPPTDDPFQP